MQKCKATRAVIIPSGILKLGKDQFRRRKHLLKKVKRGYEIIGPVQFKAGEIFQYDGPMDRSLAILLGLSGEDNEETNDLDEGGVDTDTQHNTGMDSADTDNVHAGDNGADNTASVHTDMDDD